MLISLYETRWDERRNSAAVSFEKIMWPINLAALKIWEKNRAYRCTRYPKKFKRYGNITRCVFLRDFLFYMSVRTGPLRGNSLRFSSKRARKLVGRYFRRGFRVCRRWFSPISVGYDERPCECIRYNKTPRRRVTRNTLRFEKKRQYDNNVYLRRSYVCRHTHTHGTFSAPRSPRRAVSSRTRYKTRRRQIVIIQKRTLCRSRRPGAAIITYPGAGRYATCEIQ